MSTDDNTNCTQELDSKCDSWQDSDVDMQIEHNLAALYGADLDCTMDMARYSENKVEEDKEEEDEQEEDEEEWDEDMKDDEEKDDGKEPTMIGQGEMVNTAADNVKTMVDDQPIVRPE
jgi:hypothetical protein